MLHFIGAGISRDQYGLVVVGIFLGACIGFITMSLLPAAPNKPGTNKLNDQEPEANIESNLTDSSTHRKARRRQRT